MDEPVAVHDQRLDAFAILKMAIDVLAQRIIRWLVLGMSFALFAGCLYRPSWIRLATASIFTLLVHVPLAWRERSGR